MFEVTTRCNHDCLHCYNAWKNPAAYPEERELPTAQTLDMLGGMIDQTGARLVTLTGGEPLLREDLPEIVDYLADRGTTINLISNGTLLDAAAIERIGPKRVSVWELPLLSVEREIHDRLSGAPGAFDKVTMAVAELKAAGAVVVTVFVATKLNLPTWRQTAELAIALGADGIMFNRFNPGGQGGRNVGLLQASPAELTEALDVAEELSGTYELPISCSIAMPPCLFDTGKYKRLTFGFCAAGGDRAYYALDPVGNVRPCNHSPLILGNIRLAKFWTMADSPAMKAFMSARPAFCAGCRVELECQGGCKAAAESCYGDVTASDPFLSAYSHQARKLPR